MGSQILAGLDASGPRAGAALAAVPGWFETWEAHLSRFRPESELNQLNRRAGQPVRVSPVLWAVLQAALRAARQTGGLVTPTLLSALEAAGYDRTFQEVALAPGPARPVPRTAPDAWRRIIGGTRRHLVWLPPGLRLDFGGIAKGWAADQAARRLAAAGPALVDAGGDIAVSGPCADGSAWPVGVADPRADDRDLTLLRLRGGGVATSGRDYRRWQQNGAWQHHILDPRTGQPATTDVLSATVIGPATEAAEIAAKAALILGSRAGLAWIDARPTLAGLLVLDDGQVLRSRRFAQFEWV
jgi:thiamine biosynthesis lipoprotein